MNTTNNLVHVISIDDGGGVVVSEEKTVLVRELVRHYTPTWQGKADACRNTGTHYSVLQDVSALLNSLGVEHCVFVDTSDLVVLGPAYAQDAESYGDAPTPMMLCRLRTLPKVTAWKAVVRYETIQPQTH